MIIFCCLRRLGRNCFPGTELIRFSRGRLWSILSLGSRLWNCILLSCLDMCWGWWGRSIIRVGGIWWWVLGRVFRICLGSFVRSLRGCRIRRSIWFILGSWERRGRRLKSWNRAWWRLRWSRELLWCLSRRSWSRSFWRGLIRRGNRRVNYIYKNKNIYFILLYRKSGEW